MVFECLTLFVLKQNTKFDFVFYSLNILEKLKQYRLLFFSNELNYYKMYVVLLHIRTVTLLFVILKSNASKIKTVLKFKLIFKTHS